MLERINFTPIEEVADHSEESVLLRASQVIASEIPAFVMRQSRWKRRKLLSSLESVATRAGAMPFGSRAAWSGEENVAPDEWKRLGVTSLHADGWEGAQQLSVATTSTGTFDSYIFRWGPELEPAIEAPEEVWDVLQHMTAKVLAGVVDTKLLSQECFSTRINQGDVLFMNPTLVHMAAAVEAPRQSSSEFYYRQ